MILLISAQQASLESPTDSRFGRAAWLIRMDSDTRQWQAHPNPGAAQSGGAGVAAAQFAVDQQANAVISGSFGPHAVRALNAANIQTYVFADSAATVQQAVDDFLQGRLAAFQ